MKGKTLQKIINTPKAGLKELSSLPDNEEFNVEIISKDSGKKYTISTDALSGGEGSGIQSIVEGTNITVDNTDPENPIISATDSASSLFPNGVKLVLSSRDFQADDKDFVLYCPVPSTTITMPTTNPFSEGDYVGVVMSSPDSYFETYNDGLGGTDKIYPYTQNPSGTTLEQQSSSEVVILRATNTGSVKLLPLSGAVKESVDINGSNFKTLARHNYDKSQNAIPLSGTEVGSPVTGDIEIDGSATNFELFSLEEDSNVKSYLHFEKLSNHVSMGVIDLDDNKETSIKLDVSGILLTAPVSSEGITGSNDFTANAKLNPNSYVQYAGLGYRGTATLSSGTVTVTTDKIKTGWKIYVSCNTPSGTQGFLSAPTASIIDGTSFVINSSTGALDNSTVNWWIAP